MAYLTSILRNKCVAMDSYKSPAGVMNIMSIPCHPHDCCDYQLNVERERERERGGKELARKREELKRER